MTAGLVIGRPGRGRDRPVARTSEENPTGRVPLVLFWTGAVLLVLSSI